MIKIKDIKLSIEKQAVYKNINFCYFLLKRSVSFWIVLALYFLSSPIAIIIFGSLGKNAMINNSFIMAIINISLMSIFLFISTIKLFVESKYSSVDIFLVSKPFKKHHIFISRFLIIFTLILITSFAQFILSLILIPSFGLNINWILYNFIALIFINPFISILIFSLFILLSTLLNKIWYSIASILILFLISALPIFTRSFNTNVPISYNPSKFNSFEKLTFMNNDGNTKTYIVLKNNFSSNEGVDKNIFNEINDDNVYDYFIPGEWITSLYSSLAKNTLSIWDEKYINYAFSLIKNSYYNSNILNINSNYMLVLRPNDINPFDLSNNEYENLIIDNIKSINYLNLHDANLMESIFEKISKNDDWNNVYLSQDESNTLKALIGIYEKNNELFYYWKYFNLLKTKTPNLEIKIKAEFNDQLWNLLNFLWTSQVAQDNVNIINYFGNINNIYPSPFSINYNESITRNDFNFIKDRWFKFNNNQPYYMDMNGKYIQTTFTQLQKLSPTIVDYNSWLEYLIDNTLTFKSAELFVEKIKNLFQNIFQFKLNPNYLNPYQYSLYLTRHESTYLNHSDILIVIVIFITFGIGYLSWYRFNKMNYKNIET